MLLTETLNWKREGKKMIDSKKNWESFNLFSIISDAILFSIVFFWKTLKPGEEHFQFHLILLQNSPNVGRMSSEPKFMSSQTHHLLIYVLLQLKWTQSRSCTKNLCKRVLRWENLSCLLPTFSYARNFILMTTETWITFFMQTILVKLSHDTGV